MRISKESPRLGLRRGIDGSLVEASVSHQVRIDGQECWVKYGMQHNCLDENEERELIEHVSHQVIVLAENAAREVMSHE